MSPEPFILEICPAAEAERLDADLFGPEEVPLYGRLKTDKRRRDWLAGRLAAKRALQKSLAEAGIEASLREIQILNQESGQPYARLPRGQAPAFSLSHSKEGGLCAVARGGGLIGADWETIELRNPEVLRLAFHESELAGAARTSAREQTRLWTLKEAVLKLLGLGLSGLAEVRLPPSGLELSGSAQAAWERLGAPALALESRDAGPSLIGLAYAR